MAISGLSDLPDEYTKYWLQALDRVGRERSGAGPHARLWAEKARTFYNVNAGEVQRVMRVMTPKMYKRVQAEACKLRIMS